MSTEYRFRVTKWPYFGLCARLIDGSAENRFDLMGKKMGRWEENFGTQAGVRLICGPLDTGLTVLHACHESVL